MSQAQTKTDIANLALSLLKTYGVANIETTARGAKVENICNKWYDESRRFCLAEHTWDHATTRASLAADATPPPFGWGNRYGLPADYIRLGWIGDEDNPLDEDYYKVEDGFILTDEGAPLQLGYIYNHENILKWPPHFVQLVARRLAANIAFELTGNRNIVEAAEAQYNDYLGSSKTLDAQQTPPRRVSHSKWARAKQLGHINRGY